MEHKTCAHSACNCQVPEGSDYCSDACREGAEKNETVCTCEHSNCGH